MPECCHKAVITQILKQLSVEHYPAEIIAFGCKEIRERIEQCKEKCEFSITEKGVQQMFIDYNKKLYH